MKVMYTEIVLPKLNEKLTELNWTELLTEKFNTNDYTNSVNIQNGLFLISLIEKVNWNKCKEWKTETKKVPHTNKQAKPKYFL